MSASAGQGPRSDAISLADEAVVREVLADTVLGLWDVVNTLTRLRPSRRERYRVRIFGSARARHGTFAYEETKRVAGVLGGLGCDIITGGGPGLMQAANEGAVAAGGQARSVGIRVDLPFEQEVNAFVGMAFEHRTFFTRLHQFVLTSDAFIVAPGGIGTVLGPLLALLYLNAVAVSLTAAGYRRLRGPFLAGCLLVLALKLVPVADPALATWLYVTSRLLVVVLLGGSVAAVLVYVLRGAVVSMDRIFAAIVAYLLAGLGFAAAY
jgi:hypothetical protein